MKKRLGESHICLRQESAMKNLTCYWIFKIHSYGYPETALSTVFFLLPERGKNARNVNS